MPAKRRTPSKRRPRPTKKRREFEAIKFVPVERAFKPQIKVKALLDITGWLDRDKGIKFRIGYGKIGFVDADSARIWQAKGYIEILEGEVDPVTADELAELSKDDATISLGELPNG